MESYIVRIYRRDDNNANSIVGMVEMVGKKKNRAFKNFDELKKVLSRGNKRFSRKEPGISNGKRTVSKGKSENGKGKG